MEHPCKMLSPRSQIAMALENLYGDVAQLAERRICNAIVAGSNPVFSTISWPVE
jgi:hypothetical protein